MDSQSRLKTWFLFLCMLATLAVGFGMEALRRILRVYVSETFQFAQGTLWVNVALNLILAVCLLLLAWGMFSARPRPRGLAWVFLVVGVIVAVYPAWVMTVSMPWLAGVFPAALFTGYVGTASAGVAMVGLLGLVLPETK
jgi:hypothetical protein